MKRLIAVGILTLIFHSAAPAQGGLTAQYLYNQCVKDEQICSAYLMGVAHLMIYMGKAYQDRSFALCQNSNDAAANGITLRRIFMAWLDRHPASKQEAMVSGAMNAFKETWPCDQKK